MLNLIIGRAGTGKTEYIMNEIKREMEAGESGLLLIVPEQYSHEAERQLCAVCGDSLSLYAETLSFTRLCNRVLTGTGAARRNYLDNTGQILAMHRALESVAPSLKVFGTKGMRTEILKRLLEAIKEFRSLNITPQVLERAAEKTENPLADKLRDLALIYDAYNAVLQIHGSDSAERLTLLAEYIGESPIGDKGHIYFDGFNDFTAQEMRIIEELLRKNAKITVCLTYDPDDTGEIFEIPKKTAARLRRLAKECGAAGYDFLSVASGCKNATLGAAASPEQKIKNHTLPHRAQYKAPELAFLEKHLFDDAPPEYNKKSENITVYTAPSRYTECEYAAYMVWQLVRNEGCRWREIGIMARNWEEYASICENVFEKYDIPYFSSGKVDVLSKPPLTLIDAALEIATSGFEYKTVFKYLKSGLLDITADECAALENYVLRWQIRGTLWTREWKMPPYGYGREKDGDDKLLEQINKHRSQIIKPLLNLQGNIKGESTAEDKLKALYSFLEEIKLPEFLLKKVEELKKRGEMRLSDEYTQLWDIIISAMEQMHSILADNKLSAIEFRKLFMLGLSQNDVGVIPVSLDRTALGAMAMSRRRDLKCLILLGATDENIPTLSKSSGTLSDNERAMLRKLGTDIPAGLEDRLNREMNMLYSTLTLPSEKLVLIYSKSGGQRPSFIIKRLCAMFGIPEQTLSEDEYKTAAETPYLELLYSKGIYDSLVPRPSSIANYQLSKKAAEQLYGKEFTLSATRVDRYYSCPYKYFLQNGLKLEPRVPAEFDALAAGNLVHYVLDNVLKEIKESVGLKNVEEKYYLPLTEKYIEKYVQNTLLNFEGKNARFEYLFRRYQADVVYVVSDTIEELKRSDFEPLDLELDMSKLGAAERGFIDRVDGCKIEGKLYLRVIDYKTRKKAYSFELSDVLYGRDMQMLIYLSALKNHGNLLYGENIEPAGVLYVPARDVILKAPRNASEEDINKQRTGEMRRSGLIIDDPDVLEAMESGSEKKYLPVRTTKEGYYTGDSLVTSKQVTLLLEHVSKMLQNAKDDLKNGENQCSPYYKSENDNACTYCEFQKVCRFDKEAGGKFRYAEKKKTDEIWQILEN